MTSRFSQGLKSLGADEAEKPTALAQERSTLSTQPEADQESSDAGRYTAPSRRGKKAVTGYYDPAVRQQLAVLAAEEGRSQNDLLAEALNMLFERYHKSPIAKG